ncbi:hypothetical protein ES705_50901 [subsurface metagenome]
MNDYRVVYKKLNSILGRIQKELEEMEEELATRKRQHSSLMDSVAFP